MLLYFFAVSSSSFFSPFVAALLAYDDAWMTNGNQTMINKYIAELNQPIQIEPLWKTNCVLKSSEEGKRRGLNGVEWMNDLDTTHQKEYFKHLPDKFKKLDK
jgi:hypothetical protein